MDDLGLLIVRLPSTLTTLKIDIRQPFTLQMGYIVEDCPLLESLYIGGESICRLDGTWVPLNHEPGRSLRLRTFIITNAKLDQRFFEDFLRNTPKLSKLRLIGLLLKELTALPNVVTSLELLSTYLLHPERGYCDIHRQSVTADLLHDYLCRSPHLMHLKAIRRPVFIYNLDICSRSQHGNIDRKALDLYTDKALNYVNSQHSATAPVRHHRPIWLCRGFAQCWKNSSLLPTVARIGIHRLDVNILFHSRFI
ncbi:hypothetical protein BGZ96_007861 [Linnemannia gamsii]|uniref:Uncharacterized protein n=1 Tax=Linnemannia gamsii TaxID=64522 RepID=A0ABQ7K078_9FUNG|nr:hypothetical protein BGZ96_007861 [Linnemannia gamsii]